MPDGSDTVFMQEDVRVDAAGLVHFPTGLHHGTNVRPIGEDISEGSVVLPRGRPLRPQDVAVCAALGLTELEVRRSVRVLFFRPATRLFRLGRRADPRSCLTRIVSC